MMVLMQCNPIDLNYILRAAQATGMFDTGHYKTTSRENYWTVAQQIIHILQICFFVQPIK